MKWVVLIGLTALVFGVSLPAVPASLELPGIEIVVEDSETSEQERVSNAMRVLGLLTVLSLVPSLLVVLTSFTRIIIVLSMLRHAIGLQSTPPNTVLIALALFLTLFTMLPVIEEVNQQAFSPYMNNEIGLEDATDKAIAPVRDFMIKQTREKDLALMIDIAGQELPETVDDIQYSSLIPAFMLSEIQTAFQIGFIVFLPFLLIDILVASILMSMGMIMLPPLAISLPIKVLMFVLIDGWSLLTQSLVSSFA